MVDAILEDLYKYVKEDYLKNDLLYSFNDIYCERLGISRPQGANLGKEFTIKFDDINPTTSKIKTIVIEHTFYKYVIGSIRKSFEELNRNYFNKSSLLDSEVKKSTFFNHICKGLDELMRDLKTTDHLKDFKKEFSNGILHFKRENVINSIQRSTRLENIKNGLILRDSIIQIKRDSDSAYFRLKGMTYLLRKYGFIDESISPDTFVQIFNNRIVMEVIEWKSCLSSFCYFIKKLNNSELVADHYPYTWGIADKCFDVRNRYGVLHEAEKFRSQKPPTKLKQQQLNEILNY